MNNDLVLITLSKEDLSALIREIIADQLQVNLPKRGQSSFSEEPEILDVDQAAEFLKMAKSTLYEKTSGKRIPHLKKGKRLYFKKAELLTWLEEGKQMTDQELYRQAKIQLRRA